MIFLENCLKLSEPHAGISWVHRVLSSRPSALLVAGLISGMPSWMRWHHFSCRYLTIFFLFFSKVWLYRDFIVINSSIWLHCNLQYLCYLVYFTHIDWWMNWFIDRSINRSAAAAAATTKRGKDVDLYSAYYVQDTSNAHLRHWNWAARLLFMSPYSLRTQSCTVTQ